MITTYYKDIDKDKEQKALAEAAAKAVKTFSIRRGSTHQTGAAKVQDLYFPRLLTEQEVSELTGLSLMLLRGQRKRRQGLPYVKIGHFVRYNYDDVVRYFFENTIYPEKND